MPRSLPGAPVRQRLGVALFAGLAVIALAPASLSAGPQPHAVTDARSQLAQDLTPIPAGMGAVFVPSATRAELEPMVHVFTGDERVASGPTGRRIPLPPGPYTLVVGQGPPEWRARVNVEVRAQETVVPPAFFAALRVASIDPRDGIVETRYTIVSADGERVYGPETTSDNTAYMLTRTWLLAPGTYDVVVGGDAERSDSRAALALGAGSVVPFRLVIEGDRLVRTEIGERAYVAEAQIWSVDWTLGGTVALDRAQEQIAGFNGDAFRLGAFTRLNAGLAVGNHLAKLELSVDEQWVGLEHAFGRGLPFQKLTDEVALEFKYNFRLGRIAGPYARARATTSLFPTHIFPDKDATVALTRTDGTVDAYAIEAGDEIELLSNFGPTTLQEGVGIAVSVVDTESFGFSLTGGAAARQRYYGDGGRYLRDSSGGQIFLDELEDTQDVGMEVGAELRARLFDVIALRTTLSSFAPFDTVFGDEEFRPVFEWRSEAGLELNPWATLLYRVTVERSDVVFEDLEIQQSLALRFAYRAL